MCLVLDPISTAGLTPADVDALTTKVRDIMLREIINLTYQVRGQEAPMPASAVKATAIDLKS